MEPKKKKQSAEIRKIKDLKQKREKVSEAGNDLDGYPEYPPEEDIYKKYKEEIELNPEDPTRPKVFDILDEAADADNDVASDKDLDIPGAELDDEQESIGTEDEENNYYSLGGDNHDNLEENTDNT